MNLNTPTADALAAIDAAHAEDPADKELNYARRMSTWLGRLCSQPDPLLAIAVRAQHLKRWECPRSAFPAGRNGYLQWRRRAAEHHADAVTGILRTAGFDTASIERVRALIEKRGIAQDADVQTLEDCACLSFLEAELVPFSSRHPPDKVAGILRKTWLKMSPAARELARAFVDPPADIESSRSPGDK